ncbi:hypothetical protein DFQ03_0068 [Maribacter caenipelagi]|uniref:Uncharacterized protein n=1 Tax=Maribacter caenipelagi TaxID=1447781 RepID=A0A4R7DJM3_9FLAO|nr:hypothetical protein [Maribacter caenipelagi]TDS20815.1 hypothetical protein DFQ03_0068 [Maribacter caenipelagi]|tara:strand:- start:228 stop:554 length:327 start_codon:yes stop_codon:yes gene_type:complete
MSFVKDHIIYPMIAVLLLAGLLGPYFMKISHALNEHEEFHCISKELHIHSVEFDCDFEHYHLASFFYPDFDYPEFIALTPITEAIINNYHFLSKYQQLHFVLRGPPTC